MEDHRQKLENVMNTHHEEAKEMAMGHKHQLDDLKISTTKMPVAPADNKQLIELQTLLRKEQETNKGLSAQLDALKVSNATLGE